MVALSKQVAMGGLENPADELAEIEAGYVWREQLNSTIRMFVAGYIDTNGLKGYDACAFALTRRWGTDEHGRPVSPAQLRASLSSSTERNYFRLEWADWFACRSGDIADLLARRVKPAKTDRELYDDLVSEVREELPRRAESIVRKARTR